MSKLLCLEIILFYFYIWIENLLIKANINLENNILFSRFISKRNTLKKLIDTAFYFISGHGRGWAFSSKDMLEKFSRSQADNLLSELLKYSTTRL